MGDAPQRECLRRGFQGRLVPPRPDWVQKEIWARDQNSIHGAGSLFEGTEPMFLGVPGEALWCGRADMLKMGVYYISLRKKKCEHLSLNPLGNLYKMQFFILHGGAGLAFLGLWHSIESRLLSRKTRTSSSVQQSKCIPTALESVRIGMPFLLRRVLNWMINYKVTYSKGFC